uniref:Uncharacterized protein n=1 Tax=Ascaris lumbricoides TaxID=6252 RepID=A0A0M3I976_ASCLU
MRRYFHFKKAQFESQQMCFPESLLPIHSSLFFWRMKVHHSVMINCWRALSDV